MLKGRTLTGKVWLPIWYWFTNRANFF